MRVPRHGSRTLPSHQHLSVALSCHRQRRVWHYFHEDAPYGRWWSSLRRRPFARLRFRVTPWSGLRDHSVRFHSRANRCASAICSAVILLASKSRFFLAVSSPCRLHSFILLTGMMHASFREGQRVRPFQPPGLPVNSAPRRAGSPGGSSS